MLLSFNNKPIICLEICYIRNNNYWCYRAPDESGACYKLLIGNEIQIIYVELGDLYFVWFDEDYEDEEYDKFCHNGESIKRNSDEWFSFIDLLKEEQIYDINLSKQTMFSNKQI